jgi:predicted secreted protein
MAQPTVIPGTKLYVLLGNGATPEVFDNPCGLTTSGFEMAASTNTTLIPDCDDPEAPAWEAKDINALSAQFTGSGVMAVESFDVWKNWFQSAAIKNIQVKLDNPGLGYWQGQFILSALAYGGTRGQKVTIDVTLVNSGAVVWIDA